jgi:hypothetical protein
MVPSPFAVDVVDRIVITGDAVQLSVAVGAVNVTVPPQATKPSAAHVITGAVFQNP